MDIVFFNVSNAKHRMHRRELSASQKDNQLLLIHVGGVHDFAVGMKQTSRQTLNVV